MRRKNDILWKGMMEEIFDDLLRFIFPDVEQFVDVDRGFDFLDKELGEMYPEPDKGSDTRFVDKLVKVYRPDGGEEWFLVHVEVQGHPDNTFAERMFRYYYRIFDKYQKPITALAIFTGHHGENMPACYSYSFLGTRLKYEYNTCCITDYSDEVLSESNNPFALVILAARTALLEDKVSETVLMDRKLLVAKLLFKRGIYSKKKIRAILSFLDNYVLFDEPQTNRIFKQQLDLITGKKNTMGIIEQVAEMKAEERNKLFVQNLLKGTDFSIEKIAALADVPTDFVRSVKDNL